MRLWRAWLVQAESDFRTAEKLKLGDRCQSAAKYQQTIEKSMKALLTALEEAGVITIQYGSNHLVAKHASALVRASAGWPRELRSEIERTLKEPIIRTIKEVDEVVPSYPSSGQLAKRNTEYPFEVHAGDWSAPCEAAAFSAKELVRFENAARRIHGSAGKMISALERLGRI